MSSRSIAIEVAALLGDSVVHVKHCVLDDDRPVRRQRVLGLLALGGGLLAVFAFAYALAIAADNQRLLIAHLSAHKPAYAFRAERAPLAIEACGFGGAAGAVLFAVSALLQRRRRRTSTYVVGAATDADLPLAMPRTIIVQHRDGCFVAFDVELSLGVVVRRQIGAVGLVIQAVAAPTRHALPPPRVTRRTLAYFGASLAVHVMFALVPYLEASESRCPVDLASASLTVHVDGEGDAAPPDDDDDAAELRSNDDDDHGFAGPPGSAEGHLGHTPDDNQQRDVPRTREQAVEAARDAALAGSATSTSTAIAQMLGAPDLATGFSDASSSGIGMGGDGHARDFGAGRRNITCEECGTVPVEVERITERGTYALSGRGVRGARGSTFRCTLPAPKTVSVGGGLDAATIRRYIKRKHDQLGYCYAKELLADPSLEGVVTAQLMILPTGTVQDVSASGVSPAVSACVAAVFRSIDFPRALGGAVQVTYPITYRRTD